MPKDDPHGRPATSGLSRRDFLRGSAATALTGGLLSGALGSAPALADPALEAAAATPIAGPGAVPMQLEVNGKTLTAQLEPRTTLLDALRDHLDLTGAKKVCDRGQCGACTVLVDGKPVYACCLLAIEAQGQPITTVEGLGTPAKMHPVQAAFVEADAQQCGFCTPGFVLACKALLDAHPHPTPEELTAGLGGNLCRCGTYAGIHKAVAALSGAGGA
jgi:xanthine dehydrogenase YagT iron-sulfur-binding subunit